MAAAKKHDPHLNLLLSGEEEEPADEDDRVPPRLCGCIHFGVMQFTDHIRKETNIQTAFESLFHHYFYHLVPR